MALNPHPIPVVPLAHVRVFSGALVFCRGPGSRDAATAGSMWKVRGSCALFRFCSCAHHIKRGWAPDFDLGQAAAYLQLAAWDLGIGSCITWMHFPEKAKAVLHVPTDLNFRVVLSFGYPVSQEKPPSPKKHGRKPFDEVVRWERWL